MSEITKIEVQKRRKDRYNIYLDGKYAFPISVDGLALFKLEKGKILSDAELEEILNDDLSQKIFNKILNFISYQVRTEREIKDRLEKYLFSDVKVIDLRDMIRDRVLSKVSDLALFDDESYIRNFILTKKSSKIPPGKQKVIEFLLKKGIERELIELHIVDYDHDTEKRGAELEVEKKLRGLDNKDTSAQKNKIWKYLSGKGYSSDVIRGVVDSKFKF